MPSHFLYTKSFLDSHNWRNTKRIQILLSESDSMDGRREPEFFSIILEKGWEERLEIWYR